jgi:putative GTP pyrophosphokinase
MGKLLNQKDFFEKYNINKTEFNNTKIIWSDLEKIFEDYSKEVPNLESSAIYIFNSLMKTKNVHSVRYRIKEPEHLIEKIIRKKISDDIDINLENYKVILTDLIGLRALHLFKDEWFDIHNLITSTWKLLQKPVANYRDGDTKEYNNKFEENGCELKMHKFGYRSVHYIVKTKPAKKEYFAEIQVRTVFEEAWSEIDHTIRYPYDQQNQIFGQFLLILNRLAGSADEMGTFIKGLKNHLQEKEQNHEKIIIEKDKIISDLEGKIKNLNLKPTDLKNITEGFQKLKLSTTSLEQLKYMDLGWTKNIEMLQSPGIGWLKSINLMEEPMLGFKTIDKSRLLKPNVLTKKNIKEEEK